MSAAPQWATLGALPADVAVRVRRARLHDVGRMWSLSQPFTDSGALLARTRGDFAADVDDFFVIEVSGEVVGCLGVASFGPQAELFNVCIQADWQGARLGRLLVEAVIGELQEGGFTEVFVFTVTAEAWFTSLGFERANLSDIPLGRLRVVDRERGSLPLRRGLGPSGPSAREVPTVVFRRSAVARPWTGEHGSLLEMALAEGVNVRSLCRAGICGRCRVRLVSGRVCHDLDPGVPLRENEVLLCISRPDGDVTLDR